jgi:hypothetical protein
VLTPASLIVVPALSVSWPDQVSPSFGAATLACWPVWFGDFHISPRMTMPPRTAAFGCATSQKSPWTATTQPGVRAHIERTVSRPPPTTLCADITFNEALLLFITRAT